MIEISGGIMKKYTAIDKPVTAKENCLICGKNIGVTNFTGKEGVCSDRCFSIAISLGASPSEVVIFNPIERYLRKIVVNGLQKVATPRDLHAYIAMQVKDIKTVSYIPEYDFVTTWNSLVYDHLCNTGETPYEELSFFFKFTKEELYVNLYYGGWGAGTALAIGGIGMVKLDHTDRWLVLVNNQIMGEYHLRKMIFEGQYFGEFGSVLDKSENFNCQNLFMSSLKPLFSLPVYLS